MNLFYYDTPVGKIGIAENQGSITNLYFGNTPIPAGPVTQETPLLKEAASQLRAYLAGTLKEFSLPLAPDGTNFMNQVWKALLSVPYGKTASYQNIAAIIKNPKAVRAVGMANHRNPIPIFIPCHRIIGKNGKLIGYRGGLELKERLLELERIHK